LKVSIRDVQPESELSGQKIYEQRGAAEQNYFGRNHNSATNKPDTCQERKRTNYDVRKHTLEDRIRREEAPRKRL
jgi:hypothetical protein